MKSLVQWSPGYSETESITSLVRTMPKEWIYHHHRLFCLFFFFEGHEYKLTHTYSWIQKSEDPQSIGLKYFSTFPYYIKFSKSSIKCAESIPCSGCVFIFTSTQHVIWPGCPNSSIQTVKRYLPLFRKYHSMSSPSAFILSISVWLRLMWDRNHTHYFFEELSYYGWNTHLSQYETQLFPCSWKKAHL